MSTFNATILVAVLYCRPHKDQWRPIHHFKQKILTRHKQTLPQSPTKNFTEMVLRLRDVACDIRIKSALPHDLFFHGLSYSLASFKDFTSALDTYSELVSAACGEDDPGWGNHVVIRFVRHDDTTHTTTTATRITDPLGIAKIFDRIDEAVVEAPTGDVDIERSLGEADPRSCTLQCETCNSPSDPREVCAAATGEGVRRVYRTVEDYDE